MTTFKKLPTVAPMQNSHTQKNALANSSIAHSGSSGSRNSAAASGIAISIGIDRARRRDRENAGLRERLTERALIDNVSPSLRLSVPLSFRRSLAPKHRPRHLRRLLGGNRVRPQINVVLLHVLVRDPGIHVAPLLNIHQV